MDELRKIINNRQIKLLIWDFDGVIFDLVWDFETSAKEFLAELYESINVIDSSIIEDKDDFIASLFPYPAINEVGIRHGKEVQDKVKALYERKESAAIHKAIPNQEAIDFIQKLELPQAIWSNNLSPTIKALLEEANIVDKISHLSTLDMVLESKPHIEGFKLIKDHYPDIRLENILFVGDSLRSDKIAAEKCGIGFWHYARA